MDAEKAPAIERHLFQTLTLKSLERDGIVTRTVYPTNPPRVDYELTERGKTLIVPLQALRRPDQMKLLHIDSSISGGQSVSRQLTASTSAILERGQPTGLSLAQIPKLLVLPWAEHRRLLD